MYLRRHQLTFGIAALAFAMPNPAIAQEIDFGDDSSRYSLDGECDDKRFLGTGMTSTVLLEEDISHDASDCRTAFTDGTIILRSSQPRPDTNDINWGDDSGEFAKDEECDDVRFVGNAMAESLSTDTIGKDASDCRSAYAAQSIDPNPLFADAGDGKLIDFGDDGSSYANNGECDDIRFTGDYASEMLYLADDIGHDASDCKMMLEAGTAKWQGNDLPISYGANLDEDEVAKESVDD